MNNGFCDGDTLVCLRGFTGPDCSTFDCAYNCSNHGKCVGPNQCACDQEWIGTYCSISTCNRHTSCVTCTADMRCGWCDEKQQCMFGSSVGPGEHARCASWFFYGCYTIDHISDRSNCSKEIIRQNCKLSKCDAPVALTNNVKRNCQMCLDAEYCFASNVTCKGWNETRCPNGVVRPNYADPNRILMSQLQVYCIYYNRTL